MRITSAEVIKKEGDKCRIHWSGPSGFGQIDIRYTGSGRYEIDSEHLALSTVIDIIKLAKFKEEPDEEKKVF